MNAKIVGNVMRTLVVRRLGRLSILVARLSQWWSKGRIAGRWIHGWLNSRLMLRRVVPHLRTRGVERWVVWRRLGGTMVMTLVQRRMMMRMLRTLRTWMLMLMGKVSRWCQ